MRPRLRQVPRKSQPVRQTWLVNRCEEVLSFAFGHFSPCCCPPFALLPEFHSLLGGNERAKFGKGGLEFVARNGTGRRGRTGGDHRAARLQGTLAQRDDTRLSAFRPGPKPTICSAPRPLPTYHQTRTAIYRRRTAFPDVRREDPVAS